MSHIEAPDRVPRFSIVLPTHNRADVLPFAIQSALWQTAGDFELLVVGDGCTDNSSEVVASFTDPRLRWFDLPKAPGIGYANRNVALREARGRYIAYLAHDDVWFPDHLERLGDLLDRTGAEFAYSRGLAVEIDGRITPHWYNLEIPRHRDGLWRGSSAITMCEVVHTRACLTEYGYWDETMLRAADIVMWHRILASRRFENLAFMSDPTSLHFVAGWRETRQYRFLVGGTRCLVGRFLDDLRPAPLRLPVSEHQTLQQTACTRLAAEPREAVQQIRRAVVQFQDAVLWKARSAGGLIGLRFGLALGTRLDRLYRRLRRLVSPGTRRRQRQLETRTRPLEIRRQ